MKNPKELTNEWIDEQSKELGLKICYVKVGGEESGVMKKDEKTKTTKVLGRKGRRNYEQNLEHISRRGKEEAGADRPEHIREGKRDETLQDAVTIQGDNKEEIGR